MTTTHYRDFGFKIFIAKMLESSGVETFYCYVQHPDHKKEPGHLFCEGKGILNTYNDTDIDKVRYMASMWANFFGMPFDSIIDDFTESHPEDSFNKEFRMEEFSD
jgi:hypothetical protein